MGDAAKPTSPSLPTKEECDAAYSRARTSLDGRAAPFVPGVGRLSQDFTSIDLNRSSSPSSPDESEAEPEGGYRRGSGGLVVRSHHNIAPLTASPVPSVSDTSNTSSSPPIDRSIAGTAAGVGAGVETRRGSGKFVIHSYRDIPPINTEVAMKTKTSPERAQNKPAASASTSGSTSPTETPLTATPTPSTDMASPPPPPLPSRPEEDGSRERGSTDPVTEASAWEEMASSVVDGEGNHSSGGDGRTNSPSIRVGPAEDLDLSIFCGTWNVAGRKLDSAQDLGLWLDAENQDGDGEAGDPPDLFVIGFQEVVELSAQNVVMDSFLDTQSRANSLQWFTHVYAYLAEYGQRHGLKYAMVSEQRLLGTYILVMATEALCTKIAHVQSAVVPTGLGGYFGNKGAVAVRMEVAGRSSLCFVCVHMAAHREQVVARNAEYKVIASREVFADTTGRLPKDAMEDLDVGGKDKDQDRRQGGTWGGLFGGAAQGQQGGRSGGGSGSGGMSPTRSAEVKKAIRAAMAFGLSKGKGGEEAAKASPGLNVADGSGNGAVKGTSVGAEQDAVDDFAWESSVHNTSAGLRKTQTVLQADIVFWIGDLNYRIVEGVPDEDVFKMLKDGDLESLRGKDQLNIARNTGAAFQEFQEGPLTFPPSYKYIPGTRDFDNRPEKKVRCPSWCDRVLYAVGTQSGDSVKRLGLDNYWSSGPLLSDHMPVSALFHTTLACAPEKSVVEPEMEVQPLSPRRAAAEAAFEATPFVRVVLDPPALELVLDQKPLQSARAKITNAGGKKGKFHVCKDDLPRWMSLDGSERGELGPGETAEIGIAIDVAGAEAAAREEANGGPRQGNICALLRVEVDGGGSGTMLPVVCTLSDI